MAIKLSERTRCRTARLIGQAAQNLAMKSMTSTRSTSCRNRREETLNSSAHAAHGLQKSPISLPTISLIIGILAIFLNFTAAAAPTNFVLLVECSPRMALRKEAVTDITREIVSSGVQDRMRRGQNLEVWFYDQTIQADAVKISWDRTSGTQFGKTAAERIAAKRFDVPANLSIIYPSLRTLLKNSGELTVFIFTDGFQSLAGTPFDEQINREMDAVRDAFYKAREPFLITLLGRNGEWIVGNVHAKLDSTIDIPEFPKPKAPEPPLAAPPHKYELPASLLAISKKEKTNAPAPTQVAATTPTTPPPQPVAELPPPKRPEPKPEPIIEKTAPVIEPKVEKKVEVPKPVEKPAPQPIAKVPETKIVETPAPTPPPAPRTEVKPIQAVTTPPPPKFPWPILLAVFGLITAGGVFAYLKLKDNSPKSHGSLITEAYNASRDETLPRLPGSPGMRVKLNLPPTNPPVQKERPKRQE
jgi:hypothetical protein